MRADKFLAGQFGSRSKARQAIDGGLVLRNGVPLLPKDDVNEDDSLEFLAREDGYVSMGGYKLARGLDAFGVKIGGVYADLGASTGGFTDCLLQRGAARVYCVDVGTSQLDERIAGDPRAVVMDKTNARYLTAESFPEPVGGITADLSFISLRLILPAVSAILPPAGEAFVLFKPQFECEGRGIGKSGILPTEKHPPLLASFYDFSCALDLVVVNAVPAPIRPKKNVEYVLYLKKGGVPMGKEAFLNAARTV